VAGVVAVALSLALTLGLAVVGVPLLLYVWKADAKWPNPLALRRSERKD